MKSASLLRSMAWLAASTLIAAVVGVSAHREARADELVEFLFWNEIGIATNHAVQSYADYQRERQLWRDKIAAAKRELERCGGCASAKAELDKWQGIENQFQHVAGSLFAAVGMPPVVGQWLGIDIPPTPGLSPAERAKLCQVARQPWVAQRSEFCQRKIDEHLTCLRRFQQNTGQCYTDAATTPGGACYWSSKFYRHCFSENYEALELERNAQEARAAGRIIPEYVDDGIVKLVFYGKVPDDFAPPLPPPDVASKAIDNKTTQQIKFRMGRSRDGFLRQATIKPFAWTDVVPSGSRCFEPGAVTEEIELRVCEDLKEMSILHHPLLLACHYTGDARALGAEALYWYGARPAAAVADPRNFLKRSREHPLSMIGDARTDCPPTLQDANSIRGRFQASLASLGIDEIPSDVVLRSNWNAGLRAEQEARLEAERTQKLVSFPIEGVFEATFATDWVNVRGSHGIVLPGARRKSTGECAIRKIDEGRFELTCREPRRTALKELAGPDEQHGEASKGILRKFRAEGAIEKGYLVVQWTSDLSIPYAVNTCEYDSCRPRLHGSRHRSSDGKFGYETVTGELVRKGELASWSSGTQLEELPELNRVLAYKLILQSKGITSLERFAALPDTEIVAFPLVYRDLREAAREFLKRNAGNREAGTATSRELAALPNESSKAGAPASLSPPTLTGTWRGRYTCSPGPGALELTLQDTGNGLVWGKLAFGPLPESPALRSGSFYVWGIKHEARSELELVAGPWIQRPPGYVAINLTGRYGLSKPEESKGSTGRMLGRVSGAAGCAAFEIQRMEERIAALGKMPAQIEAKLSSYGPHASPR